jgi:ferrochelatase
MKKIAIVLFNLGGPDQQSAVKPFLYNLFSDAAIIRVPQPLRFLIAKIISVRRAPIAREIYAKMGGGSPILKNTQDQAKALESALNADGKDQYKIFIAMRYWHPFADETAQAVKQFAPDEIIRLPLYPQFSTTTTESSFKDWESAARNITLTAPTQSICCYPQEEGFIEALAESIRAAYAQASTYGKPRILFSAHGLPEKIIESGDPYQAQCILTAESLRRALALDYLDSLLCFQSRVGPLKWITPATDDEVRRAGKDGVPLVVVPIAFVSDHSETLVELDIEYRHLAQQSGVPFYHTVPAVGVAPAFIQGLVRLVHAARAQKKDCLSGTGARICPPEFSGCICRNGM